MANDIKKNILFFTDTPLSGGAELQMYLLAKFIDRKKFNPTICIGPYKTLDKLAKNFENEEIRVIRLPIKHKNDISQLHLIKDILEKEEIHILHIHLWNPASGKFALLAGKATKTPIITTEHDPFKLNPIKNFFKKLTLNYIKTITAPSNDNKKLLQSLYPDHQGKIKVIQNGIDTTWWKSQILSFGQEDREKIRKELFHAEEHSLIGLTVAELHPRKGIHILLQSIEQIIKNAGKSANNSSRNQSPNLKPEVIQNLRFVIAGDGPQRKVLERLIAKRGLTENVFLLGRQSKIPRLMKSADFFILPSVREAFGLVNLEAMISGLPIIATDAGGIPEILEDGKTGLIVPRNNSKKLAEAIQKIISSKALRQKLSKNAEKVVKEKFDAKNMAKKYQKIF